VPGKPGNASKASASLSSANSRFGAASTKMRLEWLLSVSVRVIAGIELEDDAVVRADDVVLDRLLPILRLLGMSLSVSVRCPSKSSGPSL
jgi:hypothetical protein